VQGSKGDAKRALREALGRVDRGEHVEPSKIIVAEHAAARIKHWHAIGRIGARCVEYYEYLTAQIVSGLGDIALQRLTTVDVEGWHVKMLREGFSPRTVRAAMRCSPGRSAVL
jgi:hypothetical protein